MKKIIITIIITIMALNYVNAGYDCEGIIENKDIKVYQDKINKAYTQIDKLSIEKQNEVFKRIQISLMKGGIIHKKIELFEQKYGLNSNEYKKINSIYELLYCNNTIKHDELILNFLEPMKSIENDYEDFNKLNEKEIMLDFNSGNGISDSGGILLDKETFMILPDIDSKTKAAVDKNFLYYYSESYGKRGKNILRIEDSESFKVYDGILLGDEHYFYNGIKTMSININIFKGFGELEEYGNGYSYYEDGEFFYQKRNWGSIKKIGVKSKKIEILSSSIYIYDEKIFFLGILVRGSGDDFELVEKRILGEESSMHKLIIFGKDDKYVYIKSITYGQEYFGKLELDYDSLEIVDSNTIKDKYGTFYYDKSEGKFIY